VIQMNKDNNGLMFLYPNVTCWYWERRIS